ncbi:MAG: hypothetical protein RSB67_03430 [Clostridia bacterium]
MFYKDFVKMSNGMWIGLHDEVFDFGIDETVILPNCSNYSYLYGKFIVVKSFTTLHVFSVEVETKNLNKLPKEIACFCSTEQNVFLRVDIDDTIFYIDHNCQIKFSIRPNTN